MPANLTVQLNIDGVWTSYPALAEDACTIRGGLSKNAQVADPMIGNAVLRDNDGVLSPRNPRSPLFGKIGRSTPCRLLVPDAEHLWVPTNNDQATTPDHASLDIVGDLDLRADFQPAHWYYETGTGLGGKYVTTGSQRSWAWWVDNARQISLRWSTAGTGGTTITARSTAPVVFGTAGRISVRVTLDVDNGAGGWTATFYTSTTPGVDGPWTALGDPVTGTGVTSIFASTAPLGVGGVPGIVMDGTLGRHFAQQVRSGIGGTVVANPDFGAQPAGTTSFADSAGRTWTLGAGTELRDYDVRQSGLIADWPNKWVVSGRKRWAPIQVAGPLRTLQDVKTPLRSPLVREATSVVNRPQLSAYWPAEDLSEATQIASGIGGTPMTLTGAVTPTFADNDRFPGSEPVLTLASGVRLQGAVPAHMGTGCIAWRMLADAPLIGWTADAAIVQIATTGGTVRTWVFEVSNLGGLRVRGLNAVGTQLMTSGYVAFDIWQRRQMLGFQVTQVGADVYWQIFARRIEADLSVVVLGLDGTIAGLPGAIGTATQVTVAPGQNLDGGGVGHFAIGTQPTLMLNINEAMVGWNSESAGERLVRVAAEQGKTIRILGHPGETTSMGPQKAGTELEIYRSCAVADRGILAEARDSPILEYRTRYSLYNQPPMATFTYGTFGESPELDPDEPIDDVVNDFTATREGGSSHQVVAETGRLSVQEWPDGVGRQDRAGTVVVQSDSQLFGYAGWEVHLGTWDEQRHSKVEFNWSKLQDSGKTGLAAALAAIGAGDRYLILEPLEPLPPSPIDLMVVGWTETIRARRRGFAFNNQHGRPWQVGVGGVTPADSDGTTLVGALTAVTPGTVEMVAVDVVGVPWSTSSVFPLIMEIWKNGLPAERVSVTAIAGASSPQTFTMERGIDGLTVAHDAGAELWLYEPLRVAR